MKRIAKILRTVADKIDPAPVEVDPKRSYSGRTLQAGAPTMPEPAPQPIGKPEYGGYI